MKTIPKAIPLNWQYFLPKQKNNYRQPKNSVLALVNINRTKYDRASVAAMKEFIKDNTPYIKASAIIGMEGITEVVFKGVVAFTGRKNLVVFNDAEKAKDYLAALE